jgi:hypothetical protein
LRALLTGLTLAVLVLGGGTALAVWVYRGMHRERPTVPVPVAFSSYQTVDRQVRCDFPAD